MPCHPDSIGCLIRWTPFSQPSEKKKNCLELAGRVSKYFLANQAGYASLGTPAAGDRYSLPSGDLAE